MGNRKRRSDAADLDQTEVKVNKKTREGDEHLKQKIQEPVSKVEKKSLTLTQRLNQRSTPPVSSGSNPGWNPRSDARSTPSQRAGRLRLSDRLNGRSRPPVMPNNVTPVLERPDLGPPRHRISNSKTESKTPTSVTPRLPRTPANRADFEAMEEDRAELNWQTSTDRSSQHSQQRKIANQNLSFTHQIVKNEGKFQENDDDNEEEPMDWDRTDQELIKELNDFRVNNSKNAPDLENVDETDIRLVNSTFPGIKTITLKGDNCPLMLVVDTNIFISQLNQLKKLLRMPLYFSDEEPKVVLYLPWTVLGELDALKARKQNPDLQTAARKANSFLYDLLMEKSPKIKGQTGVEEAAGQVFESLCPDDKILQTCLSLSSAAYKVLLYTNDKNLAVKAKVHKVDVSNTIKLQEDINTLLFGENTRGASTSHR